MKRNIKSHDAYYKSCMDKEPIFKGFLRMHFPCHVKQGIHLEDTESVPTVFATQDQERVADKVYRIPMRDGGVLYPLCEQQTEPEPMVSRVYTYAGGIAQLHVDGTSSNAPMRIYPLLFYTGGMPYRHSLNVLGPFLFRDRVHQRQADIHLVNVGNLSDSWLLSHGMAGLFQVIMKYVARDSRLDEILISLKPYLADAYGRPTGRSFLVETFTYCLYCGQGDTERVKLLVEEILNREDKETVMTMAQSLRLKGRQEGRQEGQQEGRQKERHSIARKLLAAGVDAKVVAQTTGLSPAELQQRPRRS